MNEEVEEGDGEDKSSIAESDNTEKQKQRQDL
jgi:hypothetical protein